MENKKQVTISDAEDHEGVPQGQELASSEHADRDSVVEDNKEDESRDLNSQALPNDSGNLVGSNALRSKSAG